MRTIAGARLRAAAAQRSRALSEYESAVGTPDERVKFARLQAANLTLSMRDRAMRIARPRDRL